MRQERLSIPGPGRVLSTVVEERAVHIRRAANVLEDAFRSTEIDRDYAELFGPRLEVAVPTRVDESAEARAAWALTNIWILARSSGAIGTGGNMLDAERWFLGVHRDSLPSLASKLSVEAERQALRLLSDVDYDQDLQDLLPYILEPYGPGSRLSVMRNPETRVARETKRRNGIFYTPADIAEYMIERILAEHVDAPHELRCLDPCCGTGVFLVGLMQLVAKASDKNSFDRLQYAINNIYGFDVSTLAVEACTFVLLHDCLPDAIARGLFPWSAWHALRLNLTAVDALTVINGTSVDKDNGTLIRDDIRAQLLDPSNTTISPRWIQPSPNGLCRVASWIGGNEVGVCLEAIYPEVKGGFDLLIGNPPYASLGRRVDEAFLRQEYVSVGRSRLTGNENTYPLFIEMMWRLTRPGKNASSLVVPLSIAYHQGRQYVACRQAMSLQGGRWSFAFFDREPHALFGEDVKTRNAIVLRLESDTTPERGSPAEVETGPLRKWTSRTRDRLFSSISFTPFGQTGLTRGIPKLHDKDQAEAYNILSIRADSMRTLWRSARTCLPIEASRNAQNPRVFIASTAYNFLNVYRSLSVNTHSPYPLSQNTVLCLEFAHDELAEIAFAILSSRLTFWMWHLLCDGFHVPRWFLESIPFGRSSFNNEQAKKLKLGGSQLWQVLQRHKIVSVNGGRQTIAYRPLSCERERDAIDEVLIDTARIPTKFIHTLRTFVQNTVLVDETDDRRRYLKSYFHLLEDSP